MTYFTLFGFMGLYSLVGMLYLVLFLRIVQKGPDPGGQPEALGSVGTGRPRPRRQHDSHRVVRRARVHARRVRAVLDGFDFGVGRSPT